MNRLFSLLSAILTFVGFTSAQITSSSYGSTNSVTGLMSHLLGIDIHQPYNILGITATVGILWVATYVIFKVGVKKIDEGLDQDGHGKSGMAGALGIDDEDSRNLLAVLTLLIVLTMIGTGAFMGMIRGWQSLILLAFSFALLAGLIFVIIGGTGGVIGGSAYVTGKSAKVTAKGVNEIQNAVNEIGDMEGRIEGEEEREEDEINDGEEDEADDKAEITAEELERVIDLIDDVEGRLNRLIEEEEEELEEDLDNLRRIIELLGEDND